MVIETMSKQWFFTPILLLNYLLLYIDSRTRAILFIFGDFAAKIVCLDIVGMLCAPVLIVVSVPKVGLSIGRHHFARKSRNLGGIRVGANRGIVKCVRSPSVLFKCRTFQKSRIVAFHWRKDNPAHRSC